MLFLGTVSGNLVLYGCFEVTFMLWCLLREHETWELAAGSG